MKESRKPSFFFGIPLPYAVITCLFTGFAIGWFFPKHPISNALYVSGTYFPKTIVTFCAFIIFTLLSAAVCKLLTYHKDRAGRFFGVLTGLYLALGSASLLFTVLSLPILTNIPFNVPGAPPPGIVAMTRQLLNTLSSVMSKQPMVQALFGGALVGFLAGRFTVLQPLAKGLITLSSYIMRVFKILICYYPFMIGCLAIGIPMKFGVKGVVMYWRTVFCVALLVVLWQIITVSTVVLTTKRTAKQIISYFCTVWPTGFGTGGSYDTLAVNLISAEHDLGLRKELAEVSIVFGTVLNKNCSLIAIVFTTIGAATLLKIPISIFDIIVLVPPVLIMGLETPGVPGGTAFFMAPVIAVLMNVPDTTLFVTTEITLFSGFIPMFNGAGNTCDDGMVGALINDRFDKYLGLSSQEKLVGEA
jgi:Na+/H+-dicarboxylate symporter